MSYLVDTCYWRSANPSQGQCWLTVLGGSPLCVAPCSVGLILLISFCSLDWSRGGLCTTESETRLRFYVPYFAEVQKISNLSASKTLFSLRFHGDYVRESTFCAIKALGSHPQCGLISREGTSARFQGNGARSRWLKTLQTPRH